MIKMTITIVIINIVIGIYIWNKNITGTLLTKQQVGSPRELLRLSLSNPSTHLSWIVKLSKKFSFSVS